MAKRLLEGPAITKGSALNQNLMIDATRGIMRVRRWPAKRGKKVSPQVKALNDRFTETLRLIKQMEPGFLLWCMERTAHSNIYPRDLAMQLLSGHGVVMQKPDGTKYFSEVFMQEVSLSLDSIGQTFGDILVRAGDFWIALPLGNEADVLTIPGPGELPAWAPGASLAGSLWWKQDTPLSGAFPTQVIAGAATNVDFRNDANAGLVLQGAVSNNDNLLAQVMPAPAFPFTVEAHFNLTMNTGVPIAGLILRNSATGLRTVFGADPVGGYGNTIIRRATGTVLNATLGTFTPRAWGLQYFLRIVATSAADIVYMVSGDGKNWAIIQANTANGQVAGLDQIGIALTSRNGATGINYLTCDYWKVS